MNFSIASKFSEDADGKSTSTVYEQDDDFKSSSSSQYNGFAPISASGTKETEIDSATAAGALKNGEDKP